MPTGEDILNLAKKHLGEPYVYGTRVDLDDPNWHSKWDCAEFCTWVIKQITGHIYGCVPSNDADDPDPWTGGWRRDAEDGVVIDCGVHKSLRTAGGILLAYGDVHHVVFSTGDGRTLGAQNHRIGVAYEPADWIDWDYGILIPGVTYV